MLGEFLDEAPVEFALEGHDQRRQHGGLDPLPFAELWMLGRDVHIAVAAKEPRKEPVLVLPQPFAAPKALAQFLWQVVANTLRAFRDAFDEMRLDPRFLLEL